jgi:predicted GIY-YIG superfamily endonuclease
MKKWNRNWKIELIEKDNPGWKIYQPGGFNDRFTFTRE